MLLFIYVNMVMVFQYLKMEKFKNYGPEEGLVTLEYIIWDIDSEGNCWLATDGSGVFKFDGKILLNLRREDGVANPEIFHIICR